VLASLAGELGWAELGCSGSRVALDLELMILLWGHIYIDGRRCAVRIRCPAASLTWRDRGSTFFRHLLLDDSHNSVAGAEAQWGALCWQSRIEGL